MSRLQNRPGHRWYGFDRQGDRFSRHSTIRRHGTDYSYQKPRRMLVAVKEGMLHPKPPTYRRLDMDDSLHKLPIEHCRTSTSRAVGNAVRNESSFTFRQYFPLRFRNEWWNNRTSTFIIYMHFCSFHRLSMKSQWKLRNGNERIFRRIYVILRNTQV